ncbi:YhgE/Pip domain-containing protein [Microbacterium immunditiarum]|uniref:Putative membrane protein n=1 Tax=Microbacterium immunditiarum TaxID=337480 RepID=A0A7Y9KL20_9MICO|nr:YhgE/Pip family protein [Microbacterium immunditiarum]NYE21261.1 putative membrane protein [Microbacterium immunditiarum]
MNLPLERARARRPVTWLTLIGVLLLPVVIGGVLVAALYNPAERLDAMSAAIVNEDDPVTIDGQMVPLGRQLTAGLVEGSDEVESNLSWTISNADDAEAGLADGTYAAVVTIPSNFSAAATSTQPGETPERATIEVATPPDSLIVDDAITAQVTQAAASLMGQELSSIYLENVFLGFTTLGDELGAAADGARGLADGAGEAASGAVSLADGVRQLSSGVGELSSGLNGWAGGARSTADGLGDWAGGARDLAANTQTLAGSLATIAGGLSQAPQIPQSMVDIANQLAQNSEQVQETVTDASAALAQLAAGCEAQGGSAEFCAQLSAVADEADAALPTVQGIIGQSDTIAEGIGGLTQLPQLASGLQSISGGLNQVSGGMDALAGGADRAAAGVSQLASGATQLASGGAELAGGASSAADGADGLASGLGQLSDGTAQLADGLATASDSLPSYTDSEATSLADVVAAPVEAEGVGSSLFGASAVPLLATLALWFGGLGTFVALQAVTRRTLTSRAPSALLALRTLAPAAGLGAVQGLLVAGVVQLAASYDLAEWSIFAAICVAAGVAFAAVNQALVAVFGGAGRWIAALVGVLAVATGVVSTVPGLLSDVAALMPTAPAYNAMLGALTEASGVGAGLAGLAIWSLLAFAATLVAVSRRRSVSAKALFAATPA